MKKLKVLFFVPSMRGGGAEKITINKIRALSSDGFDVSLVLVDRRGDHDYMLSGIRVFDLRKKRARDFDMKHIIKEYESLFNSLVK